MTTPGHKLRTLTLVKRLTLLFALAFTDPVLAAEPYLHELLERPAYRTSWDQLLQSEERLPRWISVFSRTFNGVTVPSTVVRVRGREYRYGRVCKPHDCVGNELHVLFSPDGRRAWGFLGDNAVPRWLGHPDEAIRAAISRAVEQ